MHRFRILLWAGIGLLPMAAAHAQQINRCSNAQGISVYSDRRCEDVDATARMPPPRNPGGSGLYREHCARKLSELVGQIRAAVEANDVNRLSSVYLWNGLSNAAAAQVLERLHGIVQRPLLDIAPVYADAAILPAPSSASPGLPGNRASDTASTRPRPIGLRLEHATGTGGGASRTVLSLQRHYHCFWISL